MPHYKLTLSYDGTNYVGWQIQSKGESIQNTVNRAVTVLASETVSVTGAGRTDSGVHADGQVAHFSTDKPLELRRAFRGLNGLLPPDIRVKEIQEVSSDFHARFTAIRKEYHYHICTDQMYSPFDRLYSWWVYSPINREAMQQAAQKFIGTHDFTSFANSGRPSDPKRNPVRTIDRIDIIDTPTGLRLEFEGQSFLYKMVRNITGCLVDVAKERQKPEVVSEWLTAKDRRVVAPSAPAKGLFLMRIDYPRELETGPSVGISHKEA